MQGSIRRISIKLEGDEIVKEVMIKVFDHSGVIEEQVEQLQAIQRERKLSASEACEVAKTIDFLLDSRLKYANFKK